MSAIVAYDNLVDTATLSSPSAIVPAFPLTMLQTRQLSNACRSTSSSGGFRTLSVVVTRPGGFDPTKRYFVGYLGVQPGSAYISEIAYSNDGGLTWIPLAFALTGYIFSAGRALAIINPVLPPLVGAWNVLRVTLKSTNAAAAYVGAGRLWISRFIDVPKGCEVGWELTVIERGTLDFSAGQQAYENRKGRFRQLKMTFQGVPTALAYACDDDGTTPYADAMTLSGMAPSFWGLINAVGATGELIALPRSDGPVFVDRACVYGHCDQVPAIRHQAGPFHTTELTVIEEQ